MTGEFTQEEFERAARVAEKNGFKQGLKNNFRGLEVDAENSLKIWYLGMLGEIAVARCLNIEWSENVGEDVGPYQVKAVHESNRRLAVATTTREDHLHLDQVYISVVVQGVIVPAEAGVISFDVRGWAYFSELYHDDNLDDMRNPERALEWALSNDKLHPMDTLPAVDISLVNWINPSGARHRRKIRDEREVGYYDTAFKKRGNQETQAGIDTLKRLGQWTPELEARILGTESTTEENSGKTICPESGKSEL